MSVTAHESSRLAVWVRVPHKHSLLLFATNVLHCYRLTVSPPKFMLKYNLKVMGLGGGAIGKWSGREGKALMNGISVLIRDSRSSLTPSARWGHRERMATVKQEACPHQTPDLLVPWPWTCGLQNGVMTVCCLSHLICCSFVTAALTD